MARKVNNPPTREYTPQDHDAAYKKFYSLGLVVESLLTDFCAALGFDPDVIKYLNLRLAKAVATESIKKTVTPKAKAWERRINDLVLEIPSRIDEDTGEPFMQAMQLIMEFLGSKQAGIAGRMMECVNEVFQRELPEDPDDPPPYVEAIVLDHVSKDQKGRRVPKINVYDNNRPGTQITGNYPEHRLNLLALNLDGLPIDSPVVAWCHIEQAAAGEDRKVIAVLKAIFTKYTKPSGEENLLCRRLYRRATMHDFCCKDGKPVPYGKARREILEGKDMPYMTNVQRTMQENVQKGERRGERRGLRKGREKGREEGRQEGLQEGRQEGRQEGLQEGRQEGRRDQLCRMAEKKFNGRTSKQLEALLKSVDEPAVFDQVGENIIDCDSGREFINACKGLGSS